MLVEGEGVWPVRYVSKPKVAASGCPIGANKEGTHERLGPDVAALKGDD